MRFAIGIVGLGYWGQILLRNFRQHAGFDISWLCDRHEERRKTALAVCSVARETSDPAALLADRGTDIIVVANQAAYHFDLVRRALEHGKHVFVEKPFTLSVAEAEQLCALAQAADRRLFVDHSFLFSPAYAALRDLVRTGRYGRVRRIYSRRCDFGRFQRDANVVWHLMYHDAYLLADLLGARPIAVDGSATSIVIPGIADGASAVLSYPGDIRAMVTCDLYFPEKTREFIVQCEQGILVWDETQAQPLRAFERQAAWDADAGTVRQASAEAPRVIVAEAAPALPIVIDAFHRYLSGVSAVPCDGVAALEVVRLVESLDAGCKAV